MLHSVQIISEAFHIRSGWMLSAPKFFPCFIFEFGSDMLSDEVKKDIDLNEILDTHTVCHLCGSDMIVEGFMIQSTLTLFGTVELLLATEIGFSSWPSETHVSTTFHPDNVYVGSGF